MWSAVRFKAETDTDGKVLEPVTDEMPAWIRALVDEIGQGSPPLSRGGKQAPTLIEGQV